MSRSKEVKYFAGKVAVIHGAACPIATCFCLKLIEQGARLILVDNEQTELAASLSQEINLLWGGADSNYEGVDPWGAKLIAKHFNISTKRPYWDNIKELSLTCFGKLPEFLVDICDCLCAYDIQQFTSGSHHEQTICIQPCNGKTLWSNGWLGSCQSKDCFSELLTGDINIYTRGQWDLIQTLVSSTKKQILQPGDIKGVWRIKSDNLTWILSYFLYSGIYITSSDFETHTGISQDYTSELVTRKRKQSLLIIEQMNLDSLLQKNSFLKDENKELNNSASRSSSQFTISELIYEDNEKIEQEAKEQKITDCDLMNNGTFDALLQKAKDYPIDWWQGGSEAFVSVDDINCKVMAKAAMHFAFRWIVLGYFVIGIAVPKVLGWNNP